MQSKSSISSKVVALSEMLVKSKRFWAQACRTSCNYNISSIISIISQNKDAGNGNATGSSSLLQGLGLQARVYARSFR
jgi:hypothetical protein